MRETLVASKEEKDMAVERIRDALEESAIETLVTIVWKKQQTVGYKCRKTWSRLPIASRLPDRARIHSWVMADASLRKHEEGGGWIW